MDRINLVGSKEAGSERRDPPGEVGGTENNIVAVNVGQEDMMEQLDVSQTGRDEAEGEAPWETAGRRKYKGDTGNQLHVQNRREPMVYEQREGDWSCKTQGCENFMNFKRRTHCLGCRRDKNGEMSHSCYSNRQLFSPPSYF